MDSRERLLAASSLDAMRRIRIRITSPKAQVPASSKIKEEEAPAPSTIKSKTTGGASAMAKKTGQKSAAVRIPPPYPLPKSIGNYFLAAQGEGSEDEEHVPLILRRKRSRKSVETTTPAISSFPEDPAAATTIAESAIVVSGSTVAEELAATKEGTIAEAATLTTEVTGDVSTTASASQSLVTFPSISEEIIAEEENTVLFKRIKTGKTETDSYDIASKALSWERMGFRIRGPIPVVLPTPPVPSKPSETEVAETAKIDKMAEETPQAIIEEIVADIQSERVETAPAILTIGVINQGTTFVEERTSPLVQSTNEPESLLEKTLDKFMEGMSHVWTTSNILVDQFKVAQGEISRLKQENSTMVKTMADKKSQEEAAIMELSSLRKKLKEAQERLASQGKQIKDLLEKKDDLEQECVQKNEHIGQLRATIQRQYTANKQVKNIAKIACKEMKTLEATVAKCSSIQLETFKKLKIAANLPKADIIDPRKDNLSFKESCKLVAVQADSLIEHIPEDAKKQKEALKIIVESVAFVILSKLRHYHGASLNLNPVAEDAIFNSEDQLSAIMDEIKPLAESLLRELNLS